VRSEGVGAVVLKLLSNAPADGDPIYAVIRGSAVNSDANRLRWTSMLPLHERTWYCVPPVGAPFALNTGL